MTHKSHRSPMGKPRANRRDTPTPVVSPEELMERKFAPNEVKTLQPPKVNPEDISDITFREIYRGRNS